MDEKIFIKKRKDLLMDLQVFIIISATIITGLTRLCKLAAHSGGQQIARSSDKVLGLLVLLMLLHSRSTSFQSPACRNPTCVFVYQRVCLFVYLRAYVCVCLCVCVCVCGGGGGGMCVCVAVRGWA